ncbi:MAG TPA: DNA repair protein RecN [bacterium]|nr:DNA repair protein RecN [bacterium]HOL47858.1 DNA repair protein RecN [bacterium]HPQ17897.1 DNA repair protein RecN [bacterium]
MLSELYIKNFAIIEDINLQFDNGFNVITGETGAGKSILIDAINVLLGTEKGKEEYIRKGCDKTIIYGIFIIQKNNQYIKKILEENSINFEDNKIIIKRVLQPNNNKVFLNDEPITVNLLNKITKHLVEIHGQHENQTLFDNEIQLQLVDKYAGIYEILKKYRELFFELKKIKEEYNAKKEELKDIESKKEIYKYQMNEIGNLNLKIGEDEELENNVQRYRKLSNILEYCREINFYLKNDENNIVNNLEKIIDNLNRILEFDKTIEQQINNCNEAVVLLKNFSDEFSDYFYKLNIEPEELERLENRAYQIQLLKKKYGSTIKEILDYYEEVKKKYESLENIEFDLKDLEKLIESKNIEINKLAKEITSARKKISETINKKITTELKNLEMPEAEFYIEITETEQLTEKGKDKIEFMVKTNKGEDFKPLKKIASGGELSRFMLAIKTLFAEIDETPILIFDEIDTGVSGKAGTAIARQIKKLSKSHQVFCITHLPVIAACADLHYKIYKETKAERTITKAVKLNNEEKINEIAYLMSGGNITDISLKHARELIKKNRVNEN